VSVGDVFGALAVVASVAFVWPQVVRLVRTHDADGVSPVSAVWAAAAYALWTAYGIRADLPAVTIANAQLAVGFAVVVVLVVRFGPPLPRAFLPVTAGVVAVVLAVSLLAPTDGPGLLAVVVGSSAFVPQAWVALREDVLSGVSVPTYLLVASASACWLGFGIVEADAIVIVPSVLIIPVALTVAIRAHRSHDRGDADPAVP
jgi:uncharacterized protein with PQ loop repeat